ncbi:MAG: flagellar basal body P-ring formation protein FlgA [Chthonomonadales bacterium]|nr:flagellar basal body P-ring formation protein FlgA [Chthonomonadales bacterium]
MPMHALLVLIIALAASSPTTRSATVTVRAASEVAGRTFTLGEIADIRSADAALARRLAAVEVGASPLPGLSRPVGSADILVRLRQRKIDPRTLALAFPPAIRVTRGGDPVPDGELIEAARRALLAARGDLSDGAEVIPLPLAGTFVVPPGKREYRPGAVRCAVWSTTATIPVTILVDGAPLRTLDVGFRIARYVDAVVAARDLEAGAELTGADLSVARVCAAPGSAAPLADIAQAIGKRLRRRLAAGRPIAASDLRAVNAITAGRPVRVETVVGAVRVTVDGVARSAGAVGDRVRVYLPRTRAEVAGILGDDGTVRLEVN